MRAKKSISMTAGWKSRYVIDRESAIAASRNDCSASQINQDLLIVRNRCVFDHFNKWRIRWDYLVMILACINCFMVPVEITVEVGFH